MLAFVMLAALAFTAAADALRCSVCDREIRGRYLKAAGRVFCSKRCYRRTLPRCDVCGKVIEGEWLKSGGRSFCSSRCFESTLPACELCGKRLRHAVTINGHAYCQEHADGPTCCGCGLPVARGRRLPDGRVLCRRCEPEAVCSGERALALYHQARDEVARETGFRSTSVPVLELVGLDRMPEHRRGTESNRLVQRGLYERQTNTTTTKNLLGWTLRERTEVTEKVFILFGLAPAEFMSTAAHELTHDILAEAVPAVAENGPKWVEEGVCQYVAALVCRARGFDEQVARITQCTHPDYGGGYRYLVGRFGPDNWVGVLHWLRTIDIGAIPRRAPQ